MTYVEFFEILASFLDPITLHRHFYEPRFSRMESPAVKWVHLTPVSAEGTANGC